MPNSDQPEPVGVAPTPEDTCRTEVALFRYTLILPLLRHDRQRDGTKRQMREAIAAQQHIIPHSQRRTVSVPSLRRWEKAYRNSGFDALKPRSRRDRGASRSLSAETLDRAETLKRELPTRSARTVVDILKREDASPIREERIAPRTLRRHLAARGATRARLLKRAAPFRRFEREHFGNLWQSDALDGPKLADPANPEAQRPTFLFAFLDDHTRLIPHAQFYWNEQLPRLEDCLKRAISRYGCPLAIYADQSLPPRKRGAASTAPTSATPPALPSASSASSPGLTPLRPRAKSSASSALSAPTFSPSWRAPPRSTPSTTSTRACWPGSRSSTTARSTRRPARPPSTVSARTLLLPCVRSIRWRCAWLFSTVSAARSPSLS